MTSELRFIIDGQKLCRVDNNVISSNCVAVPIAIFENLSKVWGEYDSITAEFVQGDSIIAVPLVGTDCCEVPHECLNEGYMTVYLYASKVAEGVATNVVTTDGVDVEIKRGPKRSGDNSSEPTEDVVAAIQAAATEAMKKAQAALDYTATVEDGKSAYELAVELGFDGTEAEWIESLKGADGATAYEIWLEQGNTGTEEDFIASLQGDDGKDGTSIRAFTKTANITGTVLSYKASLLLVLWAGEDATTYAYTNGSITLNKGDVWQMTVSNKAVISASLMCNINGYSPIKGVDYNDGRSAYESAVANGYEGTEEQWLASLKGSNGISVTDAVVDADGNLLITLSSGEVLNAGTLDIPKSKEYELIRSYRLTEEDVANSVKGFAFDTDYNGNVFTLKAIIVYCYFPAASSNGTFELAIKDSDGKSRVIYKRAEMLATSDRYVKIDMSLKGYWTGTSMVTTTDTGTATAVDSYARNSITNSAGYITLASNIALPLGTTIEIYGVRA